MSLTKLALKRPVSVILIILALSLIHIYVFYFGSYLFPAHRIYKREEGIPAGHADFTDRGRQISGKKSGKKEAVGRSFLRLEWYYFSGCIYLRCV